VGVEKDIRICSRFGWLMKTHPEKIKNKICRLNESICHIFFWK
jgi:hypothetical protein